LDTRQVAADRTPGLYASHSVDLKQLEYFVAVVDLGGFSRASRLLGIAQPAISRQVRGLEVELRQTLLLRNGRGATPTEAGKRLVDHARSILQQVERARREVDEAKGSPVGPVIVGLPPTLALALTAPIVREFRRRHPKATVSIVEGLSANIREWVVVGRTDVGVLYNPVASPAVEIKPLFEEQLCLVSPRTARKTAASVRLRDLPDYPLIIPSRPHAIRTLVEARLAALGARPQVALEIDAIGAILELVAEGQGHAILSPRALHSAEVARKLVARPIVQPALTSSLAIVVSAQRPSTPVQDAAVALIEELLLRVAQ
jgi:LysR family nitrogen assimilation transcriptional regulator